MPRAALRSTTPTNCVQCGYKLVSSRQKPTKGETRRHAAKGKCNVCWDRGRKRATSFPCEGGCGARATGQSRLCRPCYLDSLSRQPKRVRPTVESRMKKRALELVQDEVLFFRNVWCYDDDRIAHRLGIRPDTLQKYLEIAREEGIAA